MQPPHPLAGAMRKDLFVISSPGKGPFFRSLRPAFFSSARPNRMKKDMALLEQLMEFNSNGFSLRPATWLEIRHAALEGNGTARAAIHDMAAHISTNIRVGAREMEAQPFMLIPLPEGLRMAPGPGKNGGRQ